MPATSASSIARPETPSGSLATLASSRREVSLDQPAGEDRDFSLGDLMAADGFREEPEDLLALDGLVAALPELEREVIVLRFFEDLDQDAIAARIGYSQMHVSRLQRHASDRHAHSSSRTGRPDGGWLEGGSLAVVSAFGS